MEMQNTTFDQRLKFDFINKIIDYKNTNDLGPRIWSSRKQLFQLLKIEETVQDAYESTDYQHIKFTAGQKICLSGTVCQNIFIVYSGFLKTSWSDKNGDEKVLNFPMRGDVIGLDGLIKDQYINDVVAMTNVELIILPIKKLISNDAGDVLLKNKLLKIFCEKLIESQKIEYMIGSLPAEARVAKFLLSLGQKYHQLGFSAKSYNLKMTRNDIGSYLGLTLETVSRTLSEFNRIGLVTVLQKSIRINDEEGLKKIKRISSIRARKALPS